MLNNYWNWVGSIWVLYHYLVFLEFGTIQHKSGYHLNFNRNAIKEDGFRNLVYTHWRKYTPNSKDSKNKPQLRKIGAEKGDGLEKKRRGLWKCFKREGNMTIW